MESSRVGDVHTVLLAGGKGARLRPLTAVFPKPLVPLGDRPVIDILLRRLAATGLRDVTLCTGPLSELLVAFCGDGSKYGLSIDYVKEGSPLGTAGPLALVSTACDPVLVVNGDLLTTLDFGGVIESHVDSEADVTIALFPRDVPIDFGVVDTGEDGRFEGYREKPVFHFEVSMGIYVLSRAVVESVPEHEYLDMPDLIATVHEDGGKVHCHREDCFWLDIGRMEDYAEAQEHYSRIEALFLESGA